MLTSRELYTEVSVLEWVIFEKTASFRCVSFYYFYSFSFTSHSLACRKCSEKVSHLYLQQDTGKYSDNSSCGFWDKL